MRVFSVLLISITSLIACSDSQTSEQGELFNDGTDSQTNQNVEFDKQAMLQGLVDNVFSPAYENFQQIARQTTLDIESYCSAISQDSNDQSSRLLTAQSAWKELMTQWQQIEVMQLYPLTANNASLRNAIYSWPVVNQCAVDQDVGLLQNDPNYNIADRAAPRKGIDALEYLLFNESLAHNCPTESLAPTGWNDLSDVDKKQARCDYAIAVSNNIHADATALLNVWQGEQGFATELVNTGTGKRYESAQKAINHISDALFYLDSITKDVKLAAPIGLKANSCGSASCITDIESSLSQHSIENIKQNLIALKLIVQGGEQAELLGFDDYLIAVDAPELAQTILADIDIAISAADNFDGSLVVATQNTPDNVQELYLLVKNVTDNLKSLFITYLSLELPASSAGDAD